MIIHSYFTDGLYGWAEIFVKSFLFHHGDKYKIFFCSRDLSQKQISDLSSLTPNLYISNKPLDLNMISKRAKMPVSRILKLKDHIEKRAVTKKSVIWKQAISVEDRYRTSIIEAMNKFPSEDFLIHFDIDLYFRKRLDDLFKIVTNNDISIKFRLKSKLSRKVMGGLIGFRLCPKTKKFMKRWIYHIDNIPLYEKPIGYGQTSFYYTYLDFENKMKWGYIPSRFLSPRFDETDVIWSSNNKRGKVRNLEICYKDFREAKNK